MKYATLIFHFPFSILNLRAKRAQVGVYGGEGPPVPIPNTVVKLTCAHDTWRVTARENMMTPTLSLIF